MTAEEFLNQQDSYTKNKHVFPAGTGSIIQQNMIIFAKYHVERALQMASRKAKIIADPDSWRGNTGSEYLPDEIVDPKSILDAYPLTNIK